MEDVYNQSKTRNYIYKICKLVYFMGAPNYWFEDLEVYHFILNIHDILTKIVNYILCTFLLSQFGAFFTQHNLNEQQISDLKVCCFALTLMFSYIPTLESNKDMLKDIILHLAGKLKDVYDDDNIGRQMIRKSNFFLFMLMFLFTASYLQRGVQAFIQVINKGKNN